MSGARRKGKKPIQSLPGSKRGSFESGHMSLGVEDFSRGHLHRDILSADFDALFEWAKKRENEDKVSLGYVEEAASQPSNSSFRVDGKETFGALDGRKSSDQVNPDQRASNKPYNDHLSIKLSSPTRPRPHSALGTLSPPHIDTCLWTDNSKEWSIGSNESTSPSRPLTLAQIRFQSNHPTRSYRITSKGLIRQSSGQELMKKDKQGGGASHSLSGHESSTEKSMEKYDYRVMLLGENGVGKRALIKEFMMPDYYFNLSIDSGGKY